MFNNILPSLFFVVSLVMASLAAAAEIPAQDPTHQVQSLVKLPGQPHLSSNQVNDLTQQVKVFSTKTWLLLYQRSSTYNLPGFVDEVMDHWTGEHYHPGQETLAVVFLDTGLVDIRAPRDLRSGKDYGRLFRQAKGSLLSRVMSVLKVIDTDYQAQLTHEKKEKEAASATKNAYSKAETAATALRDKQLKAAREWHESEKKRLTELMGKSTNTEASILQGVLNDITEGADPAELYHQVSKATAVALAIEHAHQEQSKNRSLTIVVILVFFCIVVIGYMRVKSRLTVHDVHRTLLMAREHSMKTAEAMLPTEQAMQVYEQGDQKLTGESYRRFMEVKTLVNDTRAQLHGRQESIKGALHLPHLSGEVLVELILQQAHTLLRVGEAETAWDTFVTTLKHAQEEDLRQVVRIPTWILSDALRQAPVLGRILTKDAFLIGLPFQQGELRALQRSDALGAKLQAEELASKIEEVKADYHRLYTLYKRAVEIKGPGEVNPIVERCNGKTVKEICTVLEALVIFARR